MGRSKQSAPKRRHAETTIVTNDFDEQAQKQLKLNEEQQKAIEILKKAPQEVVEKAAADAIRNSLPHWENIFEQTPTETTNTTNQTSTKFPGVGIHTQISTPDAEAFTKLHDIIKEKTSHVTMTSWSGSPDDPRRRAFGFLPDTLGYKEEVRNVYLDISTPGDTKSSNQKEKERNNLASVLLKEEDIPVGFDQALERLLEYFRKCIQRSDSVTDTTIKKTKNEMENSNIKVNKTDSDPSSTTTATDLTQYLTLSNLIAAQPNLHCGRHLLPSHVDHPTKDGFGIIILTITIRGGGAFIMLETADQSKKGKFRLEDGQAYMLSDFARNACTHGVLADGTLNQDDSEEDKSFRESLNLRFGLHGWTDNDPSPSQVLKYWGENF